MKAISLSRPWHWAILHLGKRIENRSRRDGRMPAICRHRGPLLLHASKSWDAEGAQAIVDAGFIDGMGAVSFVRQYSFREHAGCIVGRFNLVEHLAPDGWYYPSPVTSIRAVRVEDEEADGLDLRWWSGGYALVLADVEETPIVPCRGALGLWTVPDEVLERLDALESGAFV